MKLLLAILISLLIAGCTAQSAYRPATGDSTGYKEIALAENHYRVQFKVHGNARSAAKKYALKRAGELTIQQGYDWFVIEKNTTRTRNLPGSFATAPTPTFGRSCGLLACRAPSHSPHEPVEDSEAVTLTILEIRMGRGIRPEKASYDAREIWEDQ